MYLYPYNPKKQRLQTDADKYAVDRAFVAHYNLTPKAVSDTACLAATALTAAAKTVTANITAPDVARNLTVVGNAAGIAGNVVVKGTDIGGNAITETIVASGTTSVAGDKAFATITDITLPAKNADGDKISVGVGSKLGLPYKLAHNTVLKTYFDNTEEATAPTVAVSASALESNTVTLSTALVTDKTVDVYLLV